MPSSNQAITSLIEPPKVQSKDGKEILAWIGRCALLTAIAGASWLATQVYQAVKTEASDIKQDVRAIHNDITSTKTELLTIQASRFTTADWQKAKEAMDSKFTEHDRRLMRVEDGMLSIKDSLKRIEDNTKNKP